MDTRQFYGRKEHDRAVRVIPSDSEDSELEESENEDSEVEESHEDWIPESGLRDSLEVRGLMTLSKQADSAISLAAIRRYLKEQI
ncbi:hypothetical protein DPX16_20126 [Anabarilius grahami]|uniref:Uncharacterized protein n=1 Tax=Anabarilius grahami TaxID=495550 RepID=A0A3N0XQR2_ANAGA|nr:hypothetical protein DPX16_20126 [Anabarilius grahami]